VNHELNTGELRKSIKVRVTGKPNQRMLWNESRNPYVVCWDGSALLAQLPVKSSVMMSGLLVGIKHAHPRFQKKTPQDSLVAWSLAAHSKSGTQFSQHNERQPDLVCDLDYLDCGCIASAKVGVTVGVKREPHPHIRLSMASCAAGRHRRRNLFATSRRYPSDRAASYAALRYEHPRKNRVTVARVPLRNLSRGTAHSSITVPASSQAVGDRILYPVSCRSSATSLAERDTQVKRRRKATILCIDDHWNGLIGRKTLLEKSGYQVIEATSAQDGLRLFQSHAVDAVVVDYQMPGTDGAVVAARMKSLKAHVPIMLLSAYGPLPEKKLRSVDKFLSKSQPPNMLLASLDSLLARRDKPFFHRWLDQWKIRNHAEKP
jgi:CheY-like chemotaxis protein